MAGKARTLLGEWLPAVTLMALIFWLSSQSYLPGPEEKIQDFLFKKLAHVLAYGALALLYLRAVRRARRPFLLAFLLAVLYAASDEFHQSLTPMREATLRDVVIDSLAAAVSLWATRQLLVGEERSWRRLAQALVGLGVPSH